jgi:hypothetical protein
MQKDVYLKGECGFRNSQFIDGMAEAEAFADRFLSSSSFPISLTFMCDAKSLDYSRIAIVLLNR